MTQFLHDTIALILKLIEIIKLSVPRLVIGQSVLTLICYHLSRFVIGSHWLIWLKKNLTSLPEGIGDKTRQQQG